MTPSRAARRDALIALLLAAVLGLAWTIRGWSDLSALRLPDTDDAVRLQQIRDWLGGQAFADLAQHRLGAMPGGLEMHWSRLADLLPAATMRLATPLLGEASATLLAVAMTPLLLLAAALALMAAIARALGVHGATAALVAALAYPATTLFMPGRIDHHGLQMVLLLIVVRAAIGRGPGWGTAAGLASAASLAIGLETAPLLAVAGAAITLRWIVEGSVARARLTAYALALAGGLATCAIGLRTGGWLYPACDGFTRVAWRGAQVAAGVPLVLALLGGLATRRRRIVATTITGVVGAAAVLAIAPDCLHPYGRVDPLLARLWLAQVAEAQPLLRAAPAEAIGYAGLAMVGLVGSALVAWRRGGPGWYVLLAMQATALALTLVQLRGAYAGTLLAAPALAAVIEAARRRGAMALVPAWLLSAGLLYPLAGKALAPPATTAAPGCEPSSASLAASLPPGTLIAPVDVGAWALAATPHHVLAAPYHRNGEGNLRALRLFLAPTATAPRINGLRAPVYVLWCGAPAAVLGMPAPAGSLAAALPVGRAPRWLRRVATAESAAVWRVIPLQDQPVHP